MKIEELNINDYQGLPLYFRKMYTNTVTNLSDEVKLLVYSKKTQSMIMREYYPSKSICKIGGNSSLIDSKVKQ